MVKKSLVCLALCTLAFASCKRNKKPVAAPEPTPKPAPARPAATPPPKAAFQVDQTSRVIVFCYHQIVNSIVRPDTELTPVEFEDQMKKLKEAGITVIPMQDFLAWRRGEKNIPAKSAIITLDDGWKSQYEVGWPILKKYGYPFTLFIYTEGIKGGKYGGGKALSWEQLGEMRDAGVDIQSHTRTHQDLRGKIIKNKDILAEIQSIGYEAWLNKEVKEPKEKLEQRLGIKTTAFAVPFGYCNEHIREVVMKDGYEALFTVNPEVINFTTPMNVLGRYAIESKKPQTFARAISFPGSASSSFASATASASSLSTQPADGTTISDTKPLIKADISSLGEVDPSSITMRVSGIGLVPAKYNAALKTVTYQTIKKLENGQYSVILSAKYGGLKKETHWSFTVDSNAKPGAAKPGAAKPAAKVPDDVVGS